MLSWWNFLGPAGKNIPPLRKYKTCSDFCRDPEFVVQGMRFGASLWEYYVEFYKCRNLDSVLVLVFEELAKDLRASLPAIAEFVAVDADDARLDRVATMCTKEFMMEHGSKFDESWVFDQLKKVGRMEDPSSYVASMRTAYERDPLAVDERWSAYFADQHAVKQALPIEVRLGQYIRTYQQRGHLAAALDCINAGQEPVPARERPSEMPHAQLLTHFWQAAGHRQQAGQTCTCSRAPSLDHVLELRHPRLQALAQPARLRRRPHRGDQLLHLGLSHSGACGQHHQRASH